MYLQFSTDHLYYCIVFWYLSCSLAICCVLTSAIMLHDGFCSDVFLRYNYVLISSISRWFCSVLVTYSDLISAMFNEFCSNWFLWYHLELIYRYAMFSGLTLFLSCSSFALWIIVAAILPSNITSALQCKYFINIIM